MKAADALNQFLESDQKEFCLTGQAGTGKTYMLYSILGDKATYCATTNKAASVLRALTGRAETIHRLLSLTVKNDFNTGKTTLIPSPKARPINNPVVVIDEASMIDKPLKHIINEMCPNSKIIYVGDDAQLAPVSSSKFSIFKLDLPQASLTQVMRSLDTPVLTEMATALRAGVFSGQNIGISERPPSILTVSGDKAAEIVQHMVTNDKWHNAIMLSFTNARAAAACMVIRKAANKSVALMEGDSVIVNSAYKQGDEWIPTDSIIRINQISDVPDTPHLILVHTDEGDLLTYRDNSRFQADVAKAATAKNWNEYFKLKDMFIDLRHAEALTIHKSQGSTFDTVFVDVSSLFSCRNPDDRRRLMYVACSRARSLLYLVM